jgi:ATP-dependent protease HslVU (ClpYQ) peptidase subunit
MEAKNTITIAVTKVTTIFAGQAARSLTIVEGYERYLHNSNECYLKVPYAR